MKGSNTFLSSNLHFPTTILFFIFVFFLKGIIVFVCRLSLSWNRFSCDFRMPLIADGSSACSQCGRQGAQLGSAPGPALWALETQFPPRPLCGECVDEDRLAANEYVKFKKACENCLTSSYVCWPLVVSSLPFPDANHVCQLCETLLENVQSVRCSRMSRDLWNSLHAQAHGLSLSTSQGINAQTAVRTLQADLDAANNRREDLNNRLHVALLLLQQQSHEAEVRTTELDFEAAVEAEDTVAASSVAPAASSSARERSRSRERS